LSATAADRVTVFYVNEAMEMFGCRPEPTISASTSIKMELTKRRASAETNSEDSEPSSSEARSLYTELQKFEPLRQRVLKEMGHDNLNDTARNVNCLNNNSSSSSSSSNNNNNNNNVAQVT